MFHKEKGIQVQLKSKGEKSISFTVYNVELKDLSEYIYYYCEALSDAKKKSSPELTIKVNTNETIN